MHLKKTGKLFRMKEPDICVASSNWKTQEGELIYSGLIAYILATAAAGVEEVLEINCTQRNPLLPR